MRLAMTLPAQGSCELGDLGAGRLLHRRMLGGSKPWLMVDHADAPAAVRAKRDVVEPRDRAVVDRERQAATRPEAERVRDRRADGAAVGDGDDVLAGVRRVQSRDPALDTQLAIALRETGRNEDALARLKRAIKREPPYAFAFHELGFLLYSLQRYDEAIAAIRRGIEVAPFASNLWVLLGSICHARHDLQGSHTAYARALSISPHLASAHYGMGTVLMSQAAYAQAAEHFRIASVNAPGDLQARLKLAGCLLEIGQTDTALASLVLTLNDAGVSEFVVNVRVSERTAAEVFEVAATARK